MNGPHVLVNDDVEGEDAVEEAGLWRVTAGAGMACDLGLLAQTLRLLRVLDQENLPKGDMGLRLAR